MSKNKKSTVKDELRPKEEELKAGTSSTFKIKDEFFDKKKTYIDKQSRTEKEIEADWFNLHVGGMKITAFKGKALTKKQLAAFNKEAKDYYLVKIK
jgi:hypothetical protein